ncbi:MAG: hypothetical protein ACK5IC_08885 [Moheibacter sp.]
MKINNWLHYVMLVGIFMFFTYAFVVYLQNDSVVRASLSGQYSNKIINNYLESRKKWAWMGYAFVPVLILIRTLVIAFLMQMAIFFMNPEQEDEPKFSQYWSITLFAEWAMLILVALKFIWFAFFQTDYDLTDLQTFNPLSLNDVIDISELDYWVAYPLNLISFWELLYWIFLVVGIKEFFKFSYWKSFLIVLSSYGIGLIIWVVFVMYLILNAT